MVEPRDIAGRHRSRTAARALWLATVGAVAVASMVFAIRGPMSAARGSLDFILVYSAARAWLFGDNPYDKAEVDQAWIDAGGPIEQRPLLRVESALIYPPTTLAMLAPFAAFPVSIAKLAWIAANLAFLGLALWSLASIAGFRIDQKRTWMLVTAALLFMPVHTTFRFGQMPLYVLALTGAAAALPRQLTSGAMLGMASAIKPQLGLPFVALDVVNRRWKSVVVAAVALVVIGVIAILPLQQRGVDWWSSWQSNVKEHQTSGQGDPSPTNPMRHQMINLQVPLRQVVDNRTVVNVVVLAVAGGLAAVFFLWPGARREASQSSDSSRRLLELSMVATLSLMIVYHRYYDAVFLLFALGWAVSVIANRVGEAVKPAWWVLILLVPFALNSNTALWWLNSRGHLPGVLTDHWWWDVVLFPHQSWAVLLIAVCLVIARRKGARLSQEGGRCAA